MALRIYQVLRDGRFEAVDSLADGLSATRRDGGFVWVALDHPARSDFAELEGALGLHPLAVEDAVGARERPKLDVYDEVLVVSLLTPRYGSSTGPLAVGRVMAFVGEAFVVTVRQEDGDTIDRARLRVQRGTHPVSSLEALHALLDTVVDDLGEVSGAVEAAILAAADRLFATERTDEAETLYGISRKLLTMAHAVQPLTEPLRHLSSGTTGHVDVESGRRFQDVLDHVLVIDREIGEYSELVEHLRSGNDSRITLQQNTDMRKIAAWAAVIAVPAAITGFYGMNVPYPGFGEVAGVVTAATLQVIAAVTLFVLFRRRDWL